MKRYLELQKPPKRSPWLTRIYTVFTYVVIIVGSYGLLYLALTLFIRVVKIFTGAF